jgi:GTP-binding protein
VVSLRVARSRSATRSYHAGTSGTRAFLDLLGLNGWARLVLITASLAWQGRYVSADGLGYRVRMSSPRIRPPVGPVVAVVGRPNVGKSTLVNRIVGGREAIVQERPGITRDRTTHPAEWMGRRFTIVDTGGWTPSWSPERRGDRIDAAIAAQAETAVLTADLVLLVVDATVGVTEQDAAAADWLRGQEAPVVLVATKVDHGGLEADLHDLYRLGLGDPVPVSGLHGRGSGDLLDAVVDRLRATGVFDRPASPEEAIPGVALIGRPNVGKSSLFNRILGEQRAIVDDRPGTTRDAVDTVVELPGGRTYRFVDTAGMRRKKAKRDATEYFSMLRAVHTLERAAVALLVIDASEPISEQEQKLARQVVDAGRALIVTWNKWDLVDEERRERIEQERDRLLGYVAFAPVVRTSAVSGRGVTRLFPVIDRVLEQWTRRVPTAVLNDWLADAVAATAPGLDAGKPVRLRYITQVAVGPPTFRVFSTGVVAPGYRRYLVRRLREQFGFEGTPLDVGVRIRPRWEEREAASPAPRQPGAARGLDHR